MEKPGVQIVGEYGMEQILAMPGKEISLGVAIANSTTDIKAGTILGQVTASGEFVPCKASATDGSQNPLVVLAEPVPANSGTATVLVYATGVFYESALSGMTDPILTALNGKKFNNLVII